MDSLTLLRIAEALSAAFAVSIGCSAAAIAQGMAIKQACDSMARQPDLAGELRFTMIIGLAMLAINCLLVALILLFVRW